MIDFKDIFYSFKDVENILLTDPEVKGNFTFDNTFFSEIKKIFDSEFGYDFKNKTCAIVGNSPNLLESRYGKQIDEYDIVIRCNHGPTEGYESFVGTKTNFRVVSSKVFGYDEITSLSKFDHEYLSRLNNQHFIIKLPLNRFPNHALHGLEKNFGGTNKICTDLIFMAAGAKQTNYIILKMSIIIPDHIILISNVAWSIL